MKRKYEDGRQTRQREGERDWEAIESWREVVDGEKLGEAASCISTYSKHMEKQNRTNCNAPPGALGKGDGATKQWALRTMYDYGWQGGAKIETVAWIKFEQDISLRLPGETRTIREV